MDGRRHRDAVHRLVDRLKEATTPDEVEWIRGRDGPCRVEYEASLQATTLALRAEKRPAGGVEGSPGTTSIRLNSPAKPWLAARPHRHGAGGCASASHRRHRGGVMRRRQWYIYIVGRA